MRVVGGIWKGRSIDAPSGRDTRPTTDRTRESIASSVLSLFDLSLEGLSVLDAFAGSGAFGIEMLSRGAARCTFVDAGRQAVRTVKGNLSSLGAAPSSYRVVSGDIFAAVPVLSSQGAPFDLVFLDPPYAMPAAEVARLLEALSAAGCVTMDGIAVYERASAAPTIEAPCATLIRSKRLGETAVDYYRIGEDHGA